MINKRKAEGLSFNMLVLAIIALVALVVLIAVFVHQTSPVSTSIADCSLRGGSCQVSCDKTTSSTAYDVECPKKGEICCIKLSPKSP